MKKIISSVICLLALFACDNNFLERNPLDQPSNEGFWNTEKDAMAAAVGCYEGWMSMDDILYFDCLSDNAYNAFTWEGFQVQATGLATPSDYGVSYMGYDKIVRYNNFLENIGRPQMKEELRARLTAEVRFLRAWDYFRKVTLYGDVPLVTEVLDIDNSNLPRSPKDEVIGFIIKELSEIALELPTSYTGSDVGRITKGAALALKARMEIFDHQYEACKKTCEEVMQIGYDLFPDYKGLFKIANENNQEVILDVQYIENLAGNWVLGVLPPRSIDGWCSINPTQSLVDAYECIDGKPIDESSVYDPKEPYQHRDPRLNISILSPGEKYEDFIYDPISPSDPHGDYYQPFGRSKTGYLVRKYVDDLSDYADMWDTGMNGIVIRYAEILLMYAESKIESNQIDDSVYQVLNQIRKRAGMPEIDRSVYSGQTKMRELLRRERRVELALEGVRWFDICRWRIGEEVMPGDVYGCRLGTVDQETGALSLTNESIFVETRIFNPDKNYLYPIPQDVIDATPAIKQNPNY